MIVGRVIDRVEIPHEPGNFMSFRQLSGVEVDDAREARSRKVLQSINYLDKDTLASMRANNTDSSQAVAQPTEIPTRDLYDWEFMLEKAIVGWEGPDYGDTACDGENKTLLDAKTREWAVDYIVEKNFVPLANSKTSEDFSTKDI